MNANQKGKRGEREWRDELRAQGYDARRGQQFSGSPDSPDVVSSLPVHFEVKRTEALRLRDAVAQAEGDARGKPWAIAHRWNEGPWLVVMKSEDWFKAIRGDFAQSCATCGGVGMIDTPGGTGACPDCHSCTHWP